MKIGNTKITRLLMMSKAASKVQKASYMTEVSKVPRRLDSVDADHIDALAADQVPCLWRTTLDTDG